MEDNTIRTDDALISTDVDKLMRIISEKKKLSLGELHRLSGMKSRNALETWVKVLEDEGYVRMDYGLMGTQIRWIGMTYHPPSAEKTIVEAKMADAEQDDESAYTAVDDTKDEFSVKEPVTQTASEDDDVSPEELLERYVRRRRTVNIDDENDIDENGDDDVKNSIMKNILEDEKSASDDEELTPATIVEEETIEPAVLEETEEDVKEADETEEDVKELEDDILEAEPEEAEEVHGPKSVYDGDVKDLISAYMEEIKEEKQKLGQMRKKKEMFYKDELSALERKAEGELVSFMDYIIKHENKLLEVKEGVLDLPEKVEDAVKIQSELDRLRVEGKKSLSETKKKVADFVDTMKTTEKQMKESIANLRSSIDEGEKRVDALERLRESIDARSEKLSASMETVRSRVADLNEKMSSLEQYTAESNEVKSEIEKQVDQLESDIKQKENEISEIENELGEVSKLSVWVKEYLNDYDSKISEIDNYVAKSDQEISSLKAAAEAKYIKKYLGELEGISDKYSDSLAHAVHTEKELNDEIEKSKQRIAQLIKESQKLMRKIGGELNEAPDYDAVKQRLSSKTAKMKKTVEEKSREKGGLAEEIKKKGKKKK